MDINSKYFIQVALLLVLFLFLCALTIKSRKSNEALKYLRRLGLVEFLHILYILVFAKREIVSGQEVSPYIKVYKKYLSSNSIYSKDPVLINLFGSKVFCAVDYKTIQEVNRNEACHDRGMEGLMETYCGGKPSGIIMNNGEEGRILKHFVVKKLVQLGLRKKEVLQQEITYQLFELLDHVDQLKAESNNKIKAIGLFSATVINVIATSIFGRKFSHDDPEFIALHKTATDITNFTISSDIGIQLSRNLGFVRDLCGYQHHCNLYGTMRKIIGNIIAENESKAKYNQDSDNLIDFFHQEMEKQKNNSELNTVFCKEQLVTVLQDFFLAGMDTTSKFLESLLMFMCLNPEVQHKVQKEIDTVLGTSALPGYYQCKSRFSMAMDELSLVNPGTMNYTVAAFWEVHRLNLMIPVVPRRTARSVEIAGHRLQKGTTIVNVYVGPRLDDTFWKNPFEFYPENFLDDNGLIVQEKVDRLLIFSSGTRVCPGEQISSAVSFTFGVGILQKYSVRKADDSEMLGPKKRTCTVNGMEDFHVSLIDR